MAPPHPPDAPRREREQPDPARPRDPVAVPHVEGAALRGGPAGKVGREPGALEDARLRAHAPAAIDDRRNPRVRRPRRPDPRLRRAERRDREELEGRARVPVPRVVRDREEHLRPVAHEATYEVREEQFIADRDAHGQAAVPGSRKRKLDRARCGAGGDPRGRDPTGDGHEEVAQQVLEGQILAEGNQLGLVVAIGDDARGRDQEGAVGDARRIAGRAGRDPDRTDHERNSSFAREIRQPIDLPLARLDRRGNRGLGPHHDLGTVASRLVRELGVAVEGRLEPLAAPLDPLVDVALQHRHPDAPGRALAGAELRREAQEVQRGDCAQRQQGRAPRTAARAPVAPRGVERGAAQRRDEGEPVHAGVGRESQQRGAFVLGVADRRPRKAGEDEGAQVLEAGPQRGDREGRREAAGREPGGGAGEARREGGHVGGEAHRCDRPDHGRGVAVGHGHHVDPVQDRRVREESGQESAAQCAGRGEPFEAEQQEEGGEPGEEQPEVDDAPAQRVGKGEEGRCGVRNDQA